jgi:hypothetical protein
MQDLFLFIACDCASQFRGISTGAAGAGSGIVGDYSSISGGTWFNVEHISKTTSAECSTVPDATDAALELVEYL